MTSMYICTWRYIYIYVCMYMYIYIYLHFIYLHLYNKNIYNDVIFHLTLFKTPSRPRPSGVERDRWGMVQLITHGAGCNMMQPETQKSQLLDNPVGGHPFLVECYSRFISVQASVIFALKVLRFISNKDVAKGCEKLRFQMLQVGFQIRSVLGVDVISIGCWCPELLRLSN